MRSHLSVSIVLAATLLAVLGLAAFGTDDGMDLRPAVSTSDAAPRRSPAPASAAGDVFGRIPAIVDRVEPAVVSVLVVTDRGAAEGSGVIVDGDKGLIVTNDHVVQGGRAIRVVLAGGEHVRARVKATDPLTDLAVLSVDRTGLPEVEFAETLPEVGELAVALGNPLGFENSVTAGIVSGLHRSIPSGGRTPALVDLIQTDASISPGNSGGALVNRDGKVIGINVAFIPPQARAVSIGFAIPSPTAASVVRQLLERGRAEHAFLGVLRANLTPGLTERLGLSAPDGVLVVSIVPASPAEAAGLGARDVILALDGKPTPVVEDLWAALRAQEPGDRVTLTVLRGSERLNITVTLADRPQGPGFGGPLS